jgi:hypothetical protein
VGRSRRRGWGCRPAGAEPLNRGSHLQKLVRPGGVVVLDPLVEGLLSRLQTGERRLVAEEFRAQAAVKPLDLAGPWWDCAAVSASARSRAHGLGLCAGAGGPFVSYLAAAGYGRERRNSNTAASACAGICLAVISDGLSVSQVASKVGVSRQTLHSWLARYEADGLEGLADRSHRPVSCPHLGWLCALRRCRCRCRDLTRLGFRLLKFRRPASVGEVADDLEIADVVGEEGGAMDIRGSGDREVDRAPTWLAATAPHSG